MRERECVRSFHDRPRPAAVSPGPPLLDPALGTWFNCNLHTGEILSLALAERDGGLRSGALVPATPNATGARPCPAPRHGPGSREVTGFTARYDFGFMETQIAANMKYGVLVIQSYNTFPRRQRPAPLLLSGILPSDAARIAEGQPGPPTPRRLPCPDVVRRPPATGRRKR